MLQHQEDLYPKMARIMEYLYKQVYRRQYESCHSLKPKLHQENKKFVL